MKYGILPTVILLLPLLACGVIKDEYQKSGKDALTVRELCADPERSTEDIRRAYRKNLGPFILEKDTAAAMNIDSLFTAGDESRLRHSLPLAVGAVFYREIHALLDLLKITRRMGWYRMEVNQLLALYGYFAEFIAEQSTWIGRGRELEEQCREALEIISRFPYSVRTERHAANFRSILLRVQVLGIMNAAEDAHGFCRTGDKKTVALLGRESTLRYRHIAWQAGNDSLRTALQDRTAFDCSGLDRKELHRLLRRAFPGSLEKVPVSFIAQ